MIAVRPLEQRTVAFSLGRPAESAQLTHALRQGGGRTCFIAEDEIMAMQLRLASTEGRTFTLFLASTLLGEALPPGLMLVAVGVAVTVALGRRLV
jgi:hypothetical protein